MKTENAENAASAPTEAAQQNLCKPTIDQQIDYLNEVIKAAQVDKEIILNSDEDCQETREAFGRDMDEHITMHREILENVIAVRNLKIAFQNEGKSFPEFPPSVPSSIQKEVSHE